MKGGEKSGWLVLFSDGKVHEVLVVTLEHIDVHISIDAIDSACIGVLPESPFTFILEGVNVVMGYPIGIVVEVGGVEIGGAEFVTCVEDGGDAIVLFYIIHPLQHLMPELGRGAVAEFLHVKHRWQIVLVELHHLAEVLGLCLA